MNYEPHGEECELNLAEGSITFRPYEIRIRPRRGGAAQGFLEGLADTLAALAALGPVQPVLTGEAEEDFPRLAVEDGGGER